MPYTNHKAPQVNNSSLSSTGVASDNGAIQSVFTYGQTPITFSKGDGLMVNATQMAKAFGKLPTDWLRLKQAEELINCVSADMGIPITGLVVVQQGGNQQGTWLHEDLALIFAQWLSPQFYLWCNNRIKELLTTGVTTVNNEDDTILTAIAILNKRIEESKKLHAAMELKLIEQAPKVLFTDAVTASKSSCLIGELAKILTQNGVKIGQNKLFHWLRCNGYLGTKGERYNIPNQVYVEQGLFEIKKSIYAGACGEMHTTHTTKVTGKGQVYFINKFLSNNRNEN